MVVSSLWRPKWNNYSQIRYLNDRRLKSIIFTAGIQGSSDTPMFSYVTKTSNKTQKCKSCSWTKQCDRLVCLPCILLYSCDCAFCFYICWRAYKLFFWNFCIHKCISLHHHVTCISIFAVFDHRCIAVGVFLAAKFQTCRQAYLSRNAYKCLMQRHFIANIG